MTTKHTWLKSAFATYGFLLVALVIEVIVFEAVGRSQGKPPFLSLASLIQILNRASVLGIASVGMTYVILTAGIDLSVGSIFAFCAVIAALVVEWAVTQSGMATGVAIPLGYSAALLAGAAAGALAGGVITKAKIPPFIATLALMSSLRGLGFIFADGQSVSDLPDGYAWLGRHRIFDLVPVGVLVLIAVFLIGGGVLRYTRFGRHVIAVGGSEESARLSGVNVNRVKFAVYTMSGLLAALSGLILSSKLNAGDPKIGQGDELDVIAAVVVGGTSLAGGRGSITGTFLGLVLITVLNQGLNWIGVTSFGQQVILGIVILAAVLLDRFKR